MLTLMLPATDDQPEVVLHLEHSLVSLSKWESKHEKPFFSTEQISPEENIAYVEDMLLGSPPDGDWISRLSVEHFTTITNYINSKQTATWFRRQENAPKPREIVTSELVYYWMISFNIPFAPCETWHFNRLMTLIEICGVKQTKPKKMSRQALAEEMRRLNAERRERLGTTG